MKATLADCDKHRPGGRQFNPWDKLPPLVLCCVTTTAINKASVVVWPRDALLQCLSVWTWKTRWLYNRTAEWSFCPPRL